MSKICLDNCGVAAVCQSCNAVKSLIGCLFHNQHRGQSSVGVAVSDSGKNIASDVAPGLVKQNRQIFKDKEGISAIGHVSLKEAQPYSASGKMGDISLAFSGSIINANELRRELMRDGHLFTSGDEVEVLARLVGQRNDPVSGLCYLAERIKGSFSLVLLTEDGVYAARDPFGFKPIVIGKGLAGCAVSSESPGITEIGMEVIRDVKPGEIIHLEEQGFTVVGQIPSQRVAHCAFEWAYTARYDSVLEDISVERARRNMGASLAKGDNIEADLVAPIPMSGIGHANGYHQASGIRHDNVFFYNRYSDRSYTPLTQEKRDSIAAEKLSLVRSAIKGQRIVLCDDSIVRGTQMSKQILRLRAAGAKEIHIRVAAPPLMAPCRYGISTRSYDELIARKHTVEQIRATLGADTLKYNCLDDLVAALDPLKKEQLCLACFTGEYPL
jgi:amidophosphoribosyltransferase